MRSAYWFPFIQSRLKSPDLQRYKTIGGNTQFWFFVIISFALLLWGDVAYDRPTKLDSMLLCAMLPQEWR